MISAVRHAHSKYLSYLDSEKQTAAVEDARKKKATQTAENIEIARKITNQVHDVEQQERQQSQEQDIAVQRLINEAATKLSTSVKNCDMQTAKVAQCWTAETIS